MRGVIRLILPRDWVEVKALSGAKVVTPAQSRATCRRAGRARVLIQDEWTAADQPLDVAWQWLTRAECAEPTLEPHGVTFKQAGRSLHLTVLEPADVKLDVEDVSHPYPDYNAVNPGLRRVVLRTHTIAHESGRFVMLAEAGPVGAADATSVKPLSKW